MSALPLIGASEGQGQAHLHSEIEVSQSSMRPCLKRRSLDQTETVMPQRKRLVSQSALLPPYMLKCCGAVIQADKPGTLRR